MTIRKIQKIFAGVLTVSVLTASLFGGSALASETETVSETTTEAASEAGSEESTGTRTIVDHTGAEVVLPEKIERVVISSILPLPSVYCLFRGSADDIVGNSSELHGRSRKLLSDQRIPGDSPMRTPASWKTEK